MLLANPQAIEDGVNDCLLKWNLGDDLAAAGLSLSAPAGRTYFDQNGVLVTGVGANVFRDQAYELSEGGVWTKVGLAELGSSNLAVRTQPTKAQLFLGSADTNVTDAPGKSGDGGFSQWLNVGGGTGVAAAAYVTSTLTPATQYTASVVIEMEDGSQPVIGTSTTTGNLALVINGAVVVTAARVRRLGSSNRYRVIGTASTGGAVASHSFGVIRYSTMADGKNFWVTGFQIEPLPIETSIINCVGAPLSRAVEQLSSAYQNGMPARGLSALIDLIDLGSSSLVSPSPVYLALGNSAPTVKIFGGSGVLSATYFNAASQTSFATANPGIASGRRLTLRTGVQAGRATLGYAQNGGAEQVVVAASAVTQDATLGTDAIYVNGFGGQTGRIGVLGVRVARGGAKSQSQLLSF